MNRVLLLGVAVFLAVVGIALLGTGVDTAQAGHGCCGCCGGCGGCSGCYGGCGGCYGGCGGYGGSCSGCGGGYGCGGCGGYGYNGGQSGGYYAAAPTAPAPVGTPAPVVAKRSQPRQPAFARRIAFRR
jgi:hypothetical protein